MRIHAQHARTGTTKCGRSNDDGRTRIATEGDEVTCAICRSNLGLRSISQKSAKRFEHEAAARKDAERRVDEHGAQWTPGTELTEDDRPERCSSKSPRTLAQCERDAGHDGDHGAGLSVWEDEPAPVEDDRPERCIHTHPNTGGQCARDRAHDGYCSAARGSVGDILRSAWTPGSDNATRPAPAEDVSEIDRVAEIASQAWERHGLDWREAVRAVWRDSEAKRHEGETDAVRAVLVPEASPTVAEYDAAYDRLASSHDGIAKSIAASLQHDRGRAVRVDASRDNAMKWLVRLSVDTGVSVKDVALIVGELRARGHRGLNVDGLK